MAKKVLILSSSPRRGGNSDTLCDEFMRGAMESGNEVEKIFLRDKIINYCTGCSTCSRYNKPCPQKDDTAEILEKMIRADVIVMATPVYFYTMSAQMKTLIDRCCGRYTEMGNKEFYFIATAAEGDRKLMEPWTNIIDWLEWNHPFQPYFHFPFITFSFGCATPFCRNQPFAQSELETTL